jgi:hypothetical protein
VARPARKRSLESMAILVKGILGFEGAYKDRECRKMDSISRRSRQNDAKRK